jgi:hypothetical protein
MALILSTLKTKLENDWLVPEGGSFPANAGESANRFAAAVASWFSTAQANGIPCSTALARQAQLALLLVPKLGQVPGTPASAAQGIVDALALYIAGQIFGAGAAAAPLGTVAAITSLTATFADLELDNSNRAEQIAQACQTLALTAVVTFPSPTPPANVT